MSLGKNIYQLRKKRGLSQEQLAEEIQVTRQTISNWELEETFPNPKQLKLLSHLFEVSVDQLIENTEYLHDQRQDLPNYGYEYISKIKINKIPLVHINFGFGFRMRKAKGIIAIGNVAKGVIAIGGIATGIIALGGLSVGLISLGALALGLLLSLGGAAFGSVAIGGVAIGLFAIGGVSIGLYSLGGVAVAKYIAKGDYAYGYIAIGNQVKGTIELVQEITTSNEIRKTILQYLPHTWNIIVEIFSCMKFG